MSKTYSLTDLLTKNNNISVYKLTTDVLQSFYLNQLCLNAYIFKLSNGDTINLLFDTYDFCHLIGLSYFGYEGALGWDKLVDNPIKISSFSRKEEFKMLKYRFKYFRNIVDLLDNPNIYIYKAENYPEFNYKSIYFAVIKKDSRYLKLGIGIGKNGISGINYAETFLVDLDKPDLNYYLTSDNLVHIDEKITISKDEFLNNRKVDSIKEASIDIDTPNK